MIPEEADQVDILGEMCVKKIGEEKEKEIIGKEEVKEVIMNQKMSLINLEKKTEEKGVVLKVRVKEKEKREENGEINKENRKVK